MDGPLLSHCMVDAKSARRCPSRFFDNPISTVFAAAATAASGDAVGVVYVKDMRVMTAVLRPLDETRWEVVCRVNGELYKAEVVSNRELAEQRLVHYKNALEATGWREG
jgi:hypothetical protein